MADLRLVVSSCDAYSDCWPGFFHGLRKYWPDCPFPVSLITNEETFSGASTLQVGPDQGWSNNLLTALGRIEEPYLLYCQEDYWFENPVDQAALVAYLGFMRSDADYVRLRALPPPDGEPSSDGRLAAISRGADYRTSLQLALWRKEALLDCLRPDQTPWQFETQPADTPMRAYCVRAPGDEPIPYVLAISRGRWCRAALEYARREGLKLDWSRRSTEGRLDAFLAFSPVGRSVIASYRGAKMRLGVR